jgi:arylsulfatase A-like enzyme
VLESAGVPVPEDMQGRSLLGLASSRAEPWRKGIYYHYYEFPYGAHKVKKHYGIRTDRYKLIHFYNDIDEWELFDLKNDPYEVNNLYGQKEFQPLADSLKTSLNELRMHYRDTARLDIGNP